MICEKGKVGGVQGPRTSSDLQERENFRGGGSLLKNISRNDPPPESGKGKGGTHR